MRSHPILPFTAAFLGIGLFSIMDAFMKSAAMAVGPFDALLYRSVIGVALVLPVWRLTGGRWPEMPVMRVHLVRSGVATAMALLFFWGLVRIPIAEAIALSFIAPLIALYLAAVFLEERIQRRAVVASLLGLAGVAVIMASRLTGIQAGAEGTLGALAVLASAVLYAVNLVLQRQQAQIASPQEIAFFQHGLVAVYLGAYLLCEGRGLALPTLPVLRDTTGAAVLAAVSLMLLAWAYARAEAQNLVTVEYTAFGWAALMGWLWFGEAVTWTTLAGVTMIVLACWIAAPRRTEQTAL